MATRKQKEELIATLKFTPRTYKVELGAYGGEVYAGRVSREIYKYFKDNNIDLDEYASDWDNELGVPDHMQPFPPGSAYECDGLVHASGATMDDGNYITVYDENGNETREKINASKVIDAGSRVGIIKFESTGNCVAELRQAGGVYSVAEKIADVKYVVANASSITTVTCKKGKTTKKVKGTNPKCPTGYKQA